MTFSTTQYPHDTIVRITDTIGGSGWQGSGVLISPDEVLTASHVVYIEGVGTATNIVVAPGYNGTSAPFGAASGTYIHYFTIDNQNDIISNKDSQYDYAVIHLSRSFSSLGYMGLQSNFGGGQVDVTGFPVTAHGLMIDSAQTVRQDSQYTLLDGVSIGKGSSGGPVWIGGAGNPHVVGLVSSESETNSTGYFTQITTAAFNQIQAWVALDDGTSVVSTGVIRGSAATIGAEFDVLEASASAGKLTSITLTDAGVPAISLTPAQLLGDKDVLRFITGTFTVTVGGATIRGRSASMLAAHLGASAANLQTVQFADGQLSFDPAAAPAQVTRLYQAALNRAPDQPGLHNWVGVLNNGGSLQDLANGFIGSAEFQARYGANLSNTAFVTQLYANVLNRGPDSLGLANWTLQLATGASRASVLVGFSESAENKNNTAATVQSGIWNVDQNGPQVARLYDAVFGRLPDVSGLQNWENTLDSAAMSLSAVAGAFTASPEFQAKYGALSNSAFVTNLYVNTLHRNPEQAGLNNWLGVLNSGGASRSDVVLGFSESQEHQANTAANIISNDPASYGIKTA
jgi:V8-like Glu-specific endopeptidase